MTFEDAERLMGLELARVAFDRANPRPRLAWEAFKRFVELPLPDLRTVTVGFACEHAADRDMTLWLQFARMLEDGSGVGRAVGCGFSMDVPVSLFGIAHGNWWWPEHGTLTQWSKDVEGSVQFLATVDKSEWTWHGYAI